MNRVLALLGAAVLVVAAVVIRGAIDDDGGGEDSGGDSLELVCGTDLAAVCDELAEIEPGNGRSIRVTVQPEADTMAALVAGDLVLDGDTAWLAAGPWPAVSEAAGDDPVELVASEVLARSPAVIVSREDRAAAIEATCGGIDWACIGEQAGGQWTALGGDAAWGRVEVGIPDPTAGDGMVAVNQAVASRLGTTDFSINDVEDDPAVATWFDRLASQSGANATGASPLGRFLGVPGSLGVVGALEAEAVDSLSTAAIASSVWVVAPEPVVTADVRLFAGDDDKLADALDLVRDADRMSDAFAAGGWREPGTGTVAEPGVDAGIIASVATPLPDDDGLPAPGVVSAVDTRWKDSQ